MKSVMEFLDYRAFLLHFYENRRNQDEVFSYRFMAKKVGMDHAYLVKLLQGKVHLAPGHIEKFVRVCGLSGREAEYFRNLVRFNKSRDPDATANLFEKLMGLAGMAAHPVEKDQFEYYSAWYHSGIRALLGHMKYRGDAGAIAKVLSPSITEKQASESVQLLERLDLVRKDNQGGYTPTDAVITTGGNLPAAAVWQFQREMIRLAEESLARHPREHRDISTVTLSIGASDLEKIRARIAELRMSIMNIASQSAKPADVFQLNVQFFPLSRIKDG